MFKNTVCLLIVILTNIDKTRAQFGKIHYIIEYNKNGDTLACYEYNKKGLLKNIKFYKNDEQIKYDKLLKTHLYLEYFYNDSNKFSLLTKEIKYGFIEKHSFCTCSDPFCDGNE